MSNAKFKSDLAKFIKKAGANAEQVVRKVALDLDKSLVLKTPVDTGRARANWQVAFNSPDISSVISNDKSGSKTLSTAQKQLEMFKLGQKVFITNSLPYIGVLEYGQYGTGPGATDKTTRDGYSIQAPYGMRDLTVAEFKQYVSKAVGQLR